MGTKASGTLVCALKHNSTYFYTGSYISNGKYFTGYIESLGEHHFSETTLLSVFSAVYGTLTEGAEKYKAEPSPVTNSHST